MKTIHTTITNNRFFPYLYLKFLKKDKFSHYFYEPQLIIRTNNYKRLTSYFKKLKIRYKTYPYPYPKLKKQYGESIKYKKINYDLIKLFHLHTKAINTYNKEELGYYLNRVTHCFFNIYGCSYLQEAKYFFKYSLQYFWIWIKNL